MKKIKIVNFDCSDKYFQKTKFKLEGSSAVIPSVVTALSIMLAEHRDELMEVLGCETCLEAVESFNEYLNGMFQNLLEHKAEKHSN